ncbi:Uncharacterised protein [Mycobacteroides abscessus]|nr:Uncharacterised protein [Mycobacteroides abscessus]
METSSNSAALSPSSSGATTPFVVSSPSQSWAPTVMSGPSPVGTWARKSARMSSKFLSTTSTVVPVSVSNDSAAAVTAS